MKTSDPIDYLAAATAMALYFSNPESVRHSLSLEKLHELVTLELGMEFNEEYTDRAVQTLAGHGIFQIINDRFADNLIVVNDSDVRSFFLADEAAVSIYGRAWTLGFDWLKTAFARPTFWQSLASDLDDDPDAIRLAPAAVGFVDFTHNQGQLEAIVEAVDIASVTIERSNAIEVSERGWMRAHLQAGLSLLKSGFAVLKEAVISTILRPLQQSLKYVVEEKGKELIQLAIKFLMSLIH